MPPPKDLVLQKRPVEKDQNPSPSKILKKRDGDIGAMFKKSCNIISPKKDADELLLDGAQVEEEKSRPPMKCLRSHITKRWNGDNDTVCDICSSEC